MHSQTIWDAAGRNAATIEFQPTDLAGLATSSLAGIQALGYCFFLELLQYYSFETQIWGAAARVFRASFFSSKCGRLQKPRMDQGNILQIRSLIEQYLSVLGVKFRFNILIFFSQNILFC